MDIPWTIVTWPLLACLLLPGILVYFGLHIVRREVIFVDLALAQMATLGTCLCLMLGHAVNDTHTYAWSVGFTLIGALIFSLTRSYLGHSRVPQEAIIGIVYVVAAAAAILFLSRTAEGNEELRRTLVGDVLVVSRGQVIDTFLLYLAVGLVHFLFRRQFFAITFAPDEARASGWNLRWWDFLFYALFGVVVTSFVQIGGVLLVFSYLIVPAVCATLLANSLRVMIVIGWAVATLAGLVGMWASFRMDLPTGAAIVCALGLLLVTAGVAAWARSRLNPGRPSPGTPESGSPPGAFSE